MDTYPTFCASTITGHEGAVHAVRFNRDGNYLISGGQDKAVRLCNPNRGTVIKAYRGHAQEVLDCEIAEDNSRFISCSADKTVFLWDVTSGRTLRKFLKHTQRVNTVRFTKDGALAVSGSYDATVKIWDMRSSSFEAVQTLNEFKDSVTCLDISENEILAGCVDGCIRNYDIRMGKIFVDHMAHPVTSAKFSQDRNCILVSTLDSTVRLMEKDTGVMLNQYKGHKAENYRIESCLSSTDAFIISGSEDNNLCVWDLVDAKLKTRLTGHTAAVCSLSYHPKETMLVTGSHDGTIKVWN